jgi:hypothetical protein
MRKTLRPIWEDADNCNGGMWKLKCSKEDTGVVWREVVLAGIGEQFYESISPFDEIVGMSVCRREKESHSSIIQIWNMNHAYESEATIVQKVQDLVPDVKFSLKFYKSNFNL